MPYRHSQAHRYNRRMAASSKLEDQPMIWETIPSVFEKRPWYYNDPKLNFLGNGKEYGLAQPTCTKYGNICT